MKIRKGLVCGWMCLPFGLAMFGACGGDDSDGASGSGGQSQQVSASCTADECCWDDCATGKNRCGTTKLKICGGVLPPWFAERKCTIWHEEASGANNETVWIAGYCPVVSSDGTRITAGDINWGKCPTLDNPPPTLTVDFASKCANPGTGGAGPGTGGSTGKGGSTPVNLCETPYRCNPKTKSMGGLDRRYLLERCEPSTGNWSQVTDCSATNCTCIASTSTSAGQSYTRCREFAGEGDCGSNYTW